MNKVLIAGSLAVVAVFAGVVYFGREAAEEPAAAAPSKPEGDAASAAKPATAAPVTTRGSAAQRPAAADPRLALLMGSPESALIEFVADREGRVIRELDNDPASPGFRRPMRDYTYAGDKVIRLVKYGYSGDQTQIVTADVIYDPDGSIKEYRESTRYEYAAK